MSYVIFDTKTTKIVRIMRNGFWQNAEYKTAGAAHAAWTRLAKQGTVLGRVHAVQHSALLRPVK